MPQFKILGKIYAIFFSSVLFFFTNNARAESVSFVTQTSSGVVDCIISSSDTPQTLRALKDKGCDLWQVYGDPATLRSLGRGAYMVLHIIKLFESGASLLTLSETCPCSGLAVSYSNNPWRIATRALFFSYYVVSLAHHALYYFTYGNEWLIEDPLLQKTLPEIVHERVVQVVKDPVKLQLLSIVLDAAALSFDCRCPGYFTYEDGSLYFNGHLWMLALNVVDFATQQFE